MARRRRMRQHRDARMRQRRRLGRFFFPLALCLAAPHSLTACRDRAVRSGASAPLPGVPALVSAPAPETAAEPEALPRVPVAAAPAPPLAPAPASAPAPP